MGENIFRLLGADEVNSVKGLRVTRTGPCISTCREGRGAIQKEQPSRNILTRRYSREVPLVGNEDLLKPLTVVLEL